MAAAYLSMMDPFPLSPDMNMTVAARRSPMTKEQIIHLNNSVPPITPDTSISNYQSDESHSFKGIFGPELTDCGGKEAHILVYLHTYVWFPHFSSDHVAFSPHDLNSWLISGRQAAILYLNPRMPLSSR
jgi:hypothetical protein